MNKVLPFCLIFLTLCTTTGSDDLVAQAEKPTSVDIEKAINDFVEAPDLAGSSIGISIWKDGKTLAGYHQDLSLAPASTLKLVTTATALGIFGSDYRFKTVIGYSGNVVNGVLKGDILIKGGGDPTLGMTNSWGLLKEIATLIKAKGIGKIEGQIIADPSIFDSQITPRTWIWEDMGNYYGAGAAGLNFMANTYQLVLKPGTVGSKAEVVKTIPQIDDLIFVNEMSTGKAGSGDNGWIFGSNYAYHKYLRGTIPAGNGTFSIKGAMPDPPLQLAQMLHKSISASGIPISGKAVSAPTQSAILPLKTITSEPLITIIKDTNFESINLNAECILKLVAHHQTGKGNTEEGAKASTDFWKLKGLDTRGMYLEDGSGLSRFNAITASQMAQILDMTQKNHPQFGNTLPKVGQEGTVKYLCKDGAANGKLRAKSGSMKRVRCYAGTNMTGNVTFCIMVNNYATNSVTAEIAKLMNQIAGL